MFIIATYFHLSYDRNSRRYCCWIISLWVLLGFLRYLTLILPQNILQDSLEQTKGGVVGRFYHLHYFTTIKKEHNSNFSTARSEAEKKASDTTDEAISGGASTSKYENARLPLLFHHSETGWRASETTKVFFGEPGGISMHHSQESWLFLAGVYESLIQLYIHAIPWFYCRNACISNIC